MQADDDEKTDPADGARADQRPVADDLSAYLGPDARPDVPEIPIEWEYVRARRRPGRPDEPLHVRPSLIEAGVAVVRDDGIDALSVAACARRAGISSGAPYSWFASASEFRCAVIASFLTDALGDAADAAAPSTPPAADEQLVMICRALVTRLGDVRIGLDDVFGPDTTTAGRDLVWARTQFLGTVLPLIHRVLGCSCGRPPRSCPATRAGWADLFTVCHGSIARYALVDDAAGRAEVVDGAARAVQVLLLDRLAAG